MWNLSLRWIVWPKMKFEDLTPNAPKGYPFPNNDLLREVLH